MPVSLAADRLEEPVIGSIRRDFAAISAGGTVGEALTQVQHGALSEQIVYFYALDADGRLQGIVPTRALLLNTADTPIAQIMSTRVVKLPHTATLLDACELFMLHRLLALPVVDARGRMLGVIDVNLYTDEIIDLADREASHDVFQLIGVRLAQVRRASMAMVVRRRFPWLLCNIAGGLACALVCLHYQSVLKQLLLLTLFMPVVLSLAESVAIQSLTLTLQSQHGKHVNWRAVRESLTREAPTGVLLGLLAGGLVGLIAWLWQGQAALAACILASVVLGVFTSALLGMLVPVVLFAIQRDPKVASGPIALTLSDVASLCYLLGLAAWCFGR